MLEFALYFKVRGSVASGGHVTENILRDKLSAIGLRANTDFNINDVTIGDDEIIGNGKEKEN